MCIGISAVHTQKKCIITPPTGWSAQNTHSEGIHANPACKQNCVTWPDWTDNDKMLRVSNTCYAHYYLLQTWQFDWNNWPELHPKLFALQCFKYKARFEIWDLFKTTFGNHSFKPPSLKSSTLTWQVSFRSVGGSPDAPGRSAQGRCFCPPVPVYWACYAASLPEVLFSFDVEVSLYRPQYTQTLTLMFVEKSIHYKITKSQTSYICMKSLHSDATKEPFLVPQRKMYAKDLITTFFPTLESFCIIQNIL